jgi:4-amino-4-deoxy-L-arabinose transferase-like glycosyltransferase
MGVLQRIRLKIVLLIIAGGITAFHLSHWLLPLKSSLYPIPLERPPLWISTDTPSPRAYFRHTLVVPFRPTRAWLILAADDYSLYVNGKQTEDNIHIINPALPFQNKVSQRSQQITSGRIAELVRAPEQSKSAHEEWRVAQFIDITPYLSAGENTLALYIQSNRVNRFIIGGAVLGEGQQIPISGSAADWRASTVSTSVNGLQWFHPSYDDLSWSFAHTLGPVEKTLFSSAAPEIWTEPFSPQLVTGPLLADGVRFETVLPARSGILPPRPAWVRLFSNWPYAVFVDDEVVGTGGGSGVVEAFDISRYVSWQNTRLSVTLIPPDNNATSPIPLFAADGRIGIQRVSTPKGWTTATMPRLDRSPEKEREGVVHALGMPQQPKAIYLRTHKDLDIDWLEKFIFLWVGITLAITLMVGCVYCCARIMMGAVPMAKKLPYWVFVPTLLSIAALEFMRIRFHESDNMIAFFDPSLSLFWLGIGPFVLLLTVWILTTYGKPAGRPVSVGQRVPWLFLIILLGWGLRTYHLGFNDLQADENVSWDAARGIIKSGIPEAVSGVYYTRSPLYHYLLAFWLMVLGDGLITARYFSILAGVAVIVAVYHLVYSISGKRYLGLITALLVAIDPWQIQFSRIVRFYQLFQLTAVTAMLYFLKGFIWKQGKHYQNGFFISCALAVLSQEVFITFFPAFFIGFFIFYRPFDWEKDRNVWVGFSAVMLITFVDIAIFAIRCLTPHVGIATSSGSIMQPHLSDLGVFWTTLFIGSNRASLFYSIFFLVGLVYWLRRPQPSILMLYGTTLVTVSTLIVLVMQVSGRYCYALYPFLMTIAVLTADALVRSMVSRMFPEVGVTGLLKQRWVALVVTILAIMTALNIEPVKLYKSYSHITNLQHQTALQYIKAYRKDTDKILTVHPMPAAIVFGGVDYYLMELLFFDELHATDRGLIDRWSGGKLVSKVDHLRDIFNKHERVWIIVDESEAPKFSPGVIAFIEGSTQVAFEFFGGKVHLWERGAGLLSSAPDWGGGGDSF